MFIGIANIGQAAPAIGLLVLLFLLTAKIGFWIGVLPIALYSLLPVPSAPATPCPCGSAPARSNRRRASRA